MFVEECASGPPASPNVKFNLETLSSLATSVMSQDTTLQLHSVTQFRKLSDIARDPQIGEIIKTGVVARFVDFLQREDAPQLQAKDALSTLETLLQMEDKEILSDACWAFSYLSDGNDDNIQAVIEAGVLPKLVRLLQHSSQTVLIPALRTIGNIATGNDIQTQYIIDNQALPCLFSLITKDQKLSIKREICWTVSNITAGNTSQIQAVIDANIIPPLLYLLANAEFDVKREAAWVITNATSCGTHEQIKYLVNHGCIKPLCDLLSCPDPRVVTVCLKGLENILKAWDVGHNNKYATSLEDAGGLDKIEALQEHENTDVYGKAVGILENYFVNEEGEGHPLADVYADNYSFPSNKSFISSVRFNFI